MHSRRAVLSGAAGALAALTGCLAGGSNVRYPSGDGTPQRGTPAVASAADAGSSADAPREIAAAAPSNPALADRTRAVADEARWFAVEYPTAIATYREAVGTVARSAGVFADRETVAVEDVETLRSTVEGRVAVAREAVGGHFHAPDRLADRADYHLDVARRFARRGDHDRTREELDRLRRFAAGMAADPYVRSSLSRGPVRNRLVDRLRRGDRDPRRPLLFQLVRVGDPADGDGADGDGAGSEAAPFDRLTGYRAYAFDRPRDDRGEYPEISEAPLEERSFLAPPVTDGDRGRVVDAYRPTFVSAGRESTLLVAVHRFDLTDGRSDVGDRRPRVRQGNTVFVQRYADPERAEAAHASLLGRVSREGTVPLGDATWDRVYYDRAGDVTYALVCRAGEFLLATGADRTAWEERVDWSDRHEATWLGGA
ncbi:hypothetical protein [Halobaculum lipolyticum]|uniref:Uncharacterized protein n=1 Tax=Halobaculum lipolyticum TaxID=3032001 RepID=A0ABD5WDJ1_9EURY|nr:hypothetical protein [Halobaculum sp. DT31]